MQHSNRLPLYEIGGARTGFTGQVLINQGLRCGIQLAQIMSDGFLGLSMEVLICLVGNLRFLVKRWLLLLLLEHCC
jgi:hypothetical protein